MVHKIHIQEHQTKHILTLLSKMVHGLQHERGCACLLLDSLGKTFKDKYTSQTKIVDELIEDFSRFIAEESRTKNLPDSVLIRLNGLTTRLSGLKELRDNIHGITMPYTKALNSYTFTFNIPLIDTMVELAHQAESFNSLNVSAYANFLQWKERLGMERALGARGFYNGAFGNPEFNDRLTCLLAEQQAYLKTFLTLASTQQRSLLNDIFKSDDNKAVEQLNKLIVNGAKAEDMELYSGEAWFHLLTSLINQLHEVEQKLIASLSDKHISEDEEGMTSLQPANSMAMETYRGFIRSLPLFTSLSDSELDSLTQYAQIRQHDKGKLLFLQGEPSSRLYIILRGWVKVYNGLENGEETILQMLSAGDTLLESAVFLNTKAPVSAQVVEEATLLSIPAPIIRKKVEENNPFAVSMLNNVSLRSQRLIHQIEQSRLKSAGDRVGWFLLSQYLDHSNESDDGLIELPFDKSVIASYLDMRPETFSRTLKKLKDQGFELRNDQIMMPDPRALCKFCDSFTAENCDRAGTEDCPQPDIEIYGDNASSA